MIFSICSETEFTNPARRLFADDSPATTLRLVDSKTATTGVVIATYQLQPAHR